MVQILNMIIMQSFHISKSALYRLGSTPEVAYIGKYYGKKENSR